MNTMLANAHPLPRCLYQGGDSRRRRRHLVDGFSIDPAAVDRFNRVLRQYADTAPVLDPDRVATAARELVRDERGASAACIRERLFRVKAARAMTADRAWEAPDEVAELVRSLVTQIREGDHLLPATLPRVAHLDDALLVDAAWPRLRAELLAYADFHRLRRLACDPADRARFDREAWRQAREDEARLREHLAHLRETSYLGASPARFAIH